MTSFPPWCTPTTTHQTHAAPSRPAALGRTPTSRHVPRRRMEPWRQGGARSAARGAARGAAQRRR
eukprot:8085-Chlamydomonas_euryale.AAC.5